MDLSHIRLTKALDIIKQIKSRLDANIFTREVCPSPSMIYRRWFTDRSFSSVIREPTERPNATA